MINFIERAYFVKFHESIGRVVIIMKYASLLIQEQIDVLCGNPLVNEQPKKSTTATETKTNLFCQQKLLS